MSYLEIKNIHKWYPVKTNTFFKKNSSFVKAVNGVDLSVDKGTVLGIIGESGCGKSTLGRLITRLENPTKGDVLIECTGSSELLKKDPKKFRRTVQIIFQNPYDSFTPRDNISEILMRPLRIHHIGESDEERKKICVSALENGGLYPAEDFLNRYPHQLSGGQLQRISIIRAMLLKPEIIVADEPVSMLDVSVRADIINMLLDLKNNMGTTVIFISHDISLTKYISDNVAVMYLGRVVEYGSASDIVDSPMHPYTKALISNSTSIDPDDTSVRIKIEGEPPTPIDPPESCFFLNRCPLSCSLCKKKYPEFRGSATHKASCCLLDKPIINV